MKKSSKKQAKVKVKDLKPKKSGDVKGGLTILMRRAQAK